ncbi:Inositol-pentakisphosphate 2-kinase, partial [Pseudolycoriella hygida]
TEERRVKEVRCKYGLLYPDVAYLPKSLNQNQFENMTKKDTFCIEIKPKQGWTLVKCNPNPFPDIHLTNIDKCRYCAMQHWKVIKYLRSKKTTQKRFFFKWQKKEGKIRKISRFCPIDLFSGYPNRMKKAINGLIEEPQNNFRICKNGEFIFDNKTEPNAINSIIKDIFGNPLASRDDFVELLRLILIKEFNEIGDRTAFISEVGSKK